MVPSALLRASYSRVVAMAMLVVSLTVLKPLE